MRTIDLESLDIFRAVVQEGGVIRAAAKLNRVQSNVTTRIKQLEERLGLRLFRRQGRSLALSPEGEFCDHCESCVSFNTGTSLNIHELDAASNLPREYPGWMVERQNTQQRGVPLK